MRRTADKVVRERWKIVCLTKISDDYEGVVRKGEDKCSVMVMHGKRNRILVRESSMEKCVEGGQRKWMNDRVTAVLLG